jgi:glycosyltransferase involved in cell wall biosynthesis
MLKVLHITGDSKFGGGSIIILRLAELAKQQGWQVDVLTTDLAFQKALSKSEIGVEPLDCIWRDTHPLRDLHGLYRLSAFLRGAGYTLVHTHTSKAGFVGRLAAKMAGVPVVLHTAHGFAFHERSSPLTVRAFAALERLAAYAADSVITVSEFHRDWADRLGIGNREKLVAIPNGIPPERVRPSRSRVQVRAELGYEHDEYVIVCVGRLAPQKGLEYLIQAVPSFYSRLGRTLKVVLVGEGPARSAIETQAKSLGIGPQVQFLGFRNDMGDLLEAADLVVLPSFREGLSIALLEAMAARKPIVTTSIGSNLEVTMRGAVALLVPPKNSTALAEAILYLASNPQEADRLARAAYARYLATYTEEQMLAAYLGKYRQLLGCKGILSNG